MNCRVLQYASLRGDFSNFVRNLCKAKMESRTGIILSIESMRNNGEKCCNILVYPDSNAGPFLGHNIFLFEYAPGN
jgi:hypothetical protein